MTRTLVVVGWGALVVGCAPGGAGETSTAASSEAAGSDGASETGAAPTTDASTGGSTGAQAPTTSTGEGTTDASTSGSPIDLGDSPARCDLFAQDCKDGEKCAAWADGGTSWNATKCVPVTGDQQPGEPCTAEGGGFSGLDDCVEGAMCWGVDEQGAGECVELCSGSEREPVCSDPAVNCSVSGDSVLGLCFEPCDPLAQDCDGGDLCLPVNGSYLCVIPADIELGQLFEPCEFVNVCAKGLLCIASEAVGECDESISGCCSPLCSIAGNGPECPGVGQECLPVYVPQPPGFADVGYCSLP